MKTTHPPTAIIPFIIMFFPILPHPRIPLLFFSSDERLEFMLLASSEVDRSSLTLGYGFGYEDVFDTRALEMLVIEAQIDLLGTYQVLQTLSQ